MWPQYPMVRLTGEYMNDQIQGEEIRINDSMYLGAKALKRNKVDEIFIYILGMKEDHMKTMYDSTESEGILLPRYDWKGDQLEDGFHCIKYRGYYFAASDGPRTTLRPTRMETTPDARISVIFKWIEIEGQQYGCIGIAYKVEPSVTLLTTQIAGNYDDTTLRREEALLDSNLYFVKGALRIQEQREIIVYVFNMSSEEMKGLHTAEQTIEVTMPRYNRLGKLARGYSCISHKGRYYGLTPFNSVGPYYTTLDVTHMVIRTDAHLVVNTRCIEIRRKLYRCLAISNKIGQNTTIEETSGVEASTDGFDSDPEITVEMQLEHIVSRANSLLDQDYGGLNYHKPGPR